MSYYPRANFVNDGDIHRQIKHTRCEMNEVNAAAEEADLLHLAEELVDLQHSADTALRILAEYHGVDLFAVRNDVVAKNRRRGYYGNKHYGGM